MVADSAANLDPIPTGKRADRGALFFPFAAFALLTLTLVGFGDNLVTEVGQPSNSDPKFIVHGLFCLAWMALLAAQASLVLRKRRRWHRKLGWAGAAVALGVVFSTLWVFVAVWRGWDALDIPSQANRLLLPSYAAAVGLAFVWRARSDRHKRLLYIATLFMLGPILSRTYDPLLVEPLLVPFVAGISEPQIEWLFWLYFGTSWTLLFVALLAYDRRIIGRAHPVTLAGMGWFAAIWAIVAIV